MKKAKQTPKPILSKSKLALALGISRQALNFHLRSPDCPPLDDIGAWEMMLAEKGRSGSAPPKLRDAIAKARLEILKETKKRLARDNAIADGEMMPVAEAIRQANEAGALFMNSLEKLCRELPPALSGLPTSGVAARIETEIENIRRHLQIKMKEIGK